MLKALLVFLIFSATYSKLEDETKKSFTITGFERFVTACDFGTGSEKFKFIINGNFDQDPVVSENFEINLASPVNTKATWIPRAKDYGFDCYIDLTSTSLTASTLSIDPTVPTQDYYEFPNWNEFFTAHSIDLTCNDFTTTTITKEKVESNYNYKLAGTWVVDNYFYNIVDQEFTLTLDNEAHTEANCKYLKDTPREITCTTTEDVTFKFKDAYPKFGDKWYYKLVGYEGEQPDTTDEPTPTETPVTSEPQPQPTDHSRSRFLGLSGLMLMLSALLI